MAKRQKSESRKLAELIAKQRNIKVKSAQNWLNRVSTGKVKKPKFNLKTDYAKRKVRQYIARQKAKPKAEQKPIVARPLPIRPAAFRFPGLELFEMYAWVRHGSAGDIRLRWIRQEISAPAVNQILNCPTLELAGQMFGRMVSYIEEVLETVSLRFRGTYYEEEYFD